MSLDKQKNIHQGLLIAGAISAAAIGAHIHNEDKPQSKPSIESYSDAQVPDHSDRPIERPLLEQAPLTAPTDLPFQNIGSRAVSVSIEVPEQIPTPTKNTPQTNPTPIPTPTISESPTPTQPPSAIESPTPEPSEPSPEPSEPTPMPSEPPIDALPTVEPFPEPTEIPKLKELPEPEPITPEVADIMERETVYIEGSSCSGFLIRNEAGTPIGALTAEHCGWTGQNSERIYGNDGSVNIVRPYPVIAKTGDSSD